jgi:hypothetical protein
MPEAPSALPVAEFIRLRRVSPTLGFASVRLPGVLLNDLRVEQHETGALTIQPPQRKDRHGRLWQHYTLQPGTREAVEREIGALWAASA